MCFLVRSNVVNCCLVLGQPTSMQAYLSAAWPCGLEFRFYDGHDRKVDGSTPTLASLLRP